MDWIDIDKQLPPTDMEIWGLNKDGNAIHGFYYLNYHGTHCLKTKIRHHHISYLKKWATYEVIY